MFPSTLRSLLLAHLAGRFLRHYFQPCDHTQCSHDRPADFAAIQANMVSRTLSATVEAAWAKSRGGRPCGHARQQRQVEQRRPERRVGSDVAPANRDSMDDSGTTRRPRRTGVGSVTLRPREMQWPNAPIRRATRSRVDLVRLARHGPRFDGAAR
jgi:hypothetical protein